MSSAAAVPERPAPGLKEPDAGLWKQVRGLEEPEPGPGERGLGLGKPEKSREEKGPAPEAPVCGG
ncbi:MAG: hypothetical protein LBH70_02890 [Spirochaetaceae bacterium]|nr:hypothetical protein [Spirochaetaceae bacterium]